jgi:hypothetical protein
MWGVSGNSLGVVRHVAEGERPGGGELGPHLGIDDGCSLKAVLCASPGARGNFQVGGNNSEGQGTHAGTGG